MGRLRNIGRLRAGGGGSAFSPASIYTGGAKGLWLDPSDISTGYQDDAGTTPQTASGQQTGKRLDKSGNGLHVTQATSSARPEYDVISGISTDYFDSSDDTYGIATVAAGTFGSSMDLFIAIKRSDAAAGIIAARSAGSNYLGAYNSAGAGSTAVASGTIQVNGSSVTNDQAALNTVLTVGNWFVFEVDAADLSTWTGFGISNYTGSFYIGADIGGVILCPAQSSGNRALIRKWLGAKVGLSL